MNVSRSEASDALEMVRQTSSKTRQMAAYAGGDLCFIIWGVVWALGFLTVHFVPPMFGYRPVVGTIITSVWAVLVALGVGTTYWVSLRYQAARSASDRRIGYMWLLFYGFIYVWAALISPFLSVSGHEQSQAFWRHIGALMATLPMFMYTVMGLWLDSLMVWIGVGITALTLVGLYLFPSVFYIWMAVLGGGGLIATGLLVRRRWR